MKTKLKLPKGWELKKLEKGVYEVIQKPKKLKNGKDYIHNDGDLVVIGRVGALRNSGFYNGDYHNKGLTCNNHKLWREATKEQVVSFFEKHLIERYGEDWKNVKIKECMYHSDPYSFNNYDKRVLIDKSIVNGWEVWNKNARLYHKGIWAEPLEEIPTIELRGLDKKWKWCAMDDGRRVYIFESKPNKNNAFNCWYDQKGNALNCKHLDQSQFTELKKLNWKDSLHKIKHV